MFRLWNSHRQAFLIITCKLNYTYLCSLGIPVLQSVWVTIWCCYKRYYNFPILFIRFSGKSSSCILKYCAGCCFLCCDVRLVFCCTLVVLLLWCFFHFFHFFSPSCLVDSCRFYGSLDVARVRVVVKMTMRWLVELYLQTAFSHLPLGFPTCLLPPKYLPITASSIPDLKTTCMNLRQWPIK
jgi:hypothetical protein